MAGKVKVLNLYAGIGGNRKLWKNVDVTAVEIDENIAKIYQDFFPEDKMIIGDAHQYLLEHYREFDVIWSSPPCPSHSRIRNEAGVGRGQNKPIYPDMKLYEEIILLRHLAKLNSPINGFKGKYVIENVISYYPPLIKPQKIGQHFFWSNVEIGEFTQKTRGHFKSNKELMEIKGLDLSSYKCDKRKLLRNCVEPELGEYILSKLTTK